MAKVMIVDDDRTTVKLLQTLLELDGFDVVVVARGGDVLDTAKSQRPDALMIDYHLADMDGVTVIKALRADPQFERLPIVMASGLDVSVEAMEAGATQFLVKPFQPDRLTAMFNSLIAQ